MTTGCSERCRFGFLTLLLVASLACSISTSFAQGEILGWGPMVVVGQEALSDLTAVA